MGLLMNYLSVCSGIEAATVAWHDMGWKPIGFSEIEKFPSQLLQHHYPHVTNYGDMTKFKEWNINEPVNLLVGGTPCQSFSVAGLRKGLEDPRGNLMLTYLGIAEKFKPKWLLWENVPGVLSSNGGEDFACLLKGMAELGYGFAYRVLDAQHFGVPQRRRRVFVVGCLGDWRSAAKVLFESESLQGDITPSRSKKKETSSFTTSSFGNYSEGIGTIRANGGDIGGGSETLYVSEIANCLQTTCHEWSRADGFNMIAYNITFCDANGTRKDRPNGGLYVNETDTSNTLTRANVGTYAVDTYNGTIQGDVTATITTTGGGVSSSPSVMTNNPIKFEKHQQDVIHIDATLDERNIHLWSNENLHTFPTLTATDYKGAKSFCSNLKVRRLTPMECERLQGFPNNYTNTSTSSDTTRYKALGNSMAVPVMKWIGQRINELQK
jgi:DNA (cytosine-5)-methyltransferase 1